MFVDSGPLFILMTFALAAMFAVIMGFAAFLAVLPLVFPGRCGRAVRASALTVGALCVLAYPAIFLIGRTALQDDGFLTVIMAASHVTGLTLAAAVGAVVRVHDRHRSIPR